MILVLTSSHDFTTDDVLAKLADIPVFRFNIDLWRDYRWNIGPEDFVIEDPTGRRCREADVRAVYLRKMLFDPVAIDVPAGGSEESWRREELMQVWLGLRDWAHETERLALVKPSSRGHWNKIRQMKLASRFFPVPEWRILCGSASGLDAPVVVKTLGAANLNRGGILAVREVDESHLSPDYPWFLQQKLRAATHDVTVAWVDGEIFAFELERSTFEGDDVRIPSVLDNLQWSPCSLTAAESNAVAGFMKQTGLEFGRLDFLRMDGRLWFLEVNPNGQFAWLDPHGNNGLLDTVAGAIRRVWARHA